MAEREKRGDWIEERGGRKRQESNERKNRAGRRKEKEGKGFRQNPITVCLCLSLRSSGHGLVKL